MNVFLSCTENSDQNRRCTLSNGISIVIVLFYDKRMLMDDQDDWWPTSTVNAVRRRWSSRYLWSVDQFSKPTARWISCGSLLRWISFFYDSSISDDTEETEGDRKCGDEVCRRKIPRKFRRFTVFWGNVHKWNIWQLSRQCQPVWLKVRIDQLWVVTTVTNNCSTGGEVISLFRSVGLLRMALPFYRLSIVRVWHYNFQPELKRLCDRRMLRKIVLLFIVVLGTRAEDEDVARKYCSIVENLDIKQIRLLLHPSAATGTNRIGFGSNFSAKRDVRFYLYTPLTVNEPHVFSIDTVGTLSRSFFNSSLPLRWALVFEISLT